MHHRPPEKKSRSIKTAQMQEMSLRVFLDRLEIKKKIKHENRLAFTMFEEKGRFPKKQKSWIATACYKCNLNVDYSFYKHFNGV